jgi:hypothetical protein
MILANSETQDEDIGEEEGSGSHLSFFLFHQPSLVLSDVEGN